ncbi:MAG TPA: condensation domain-containing protein [Iamia sp.]
MLRPTSPIQRGSLAIADGSASRGLLNWVYQLNGQVDVVALSAAIDQVVERHEILRTRFVTRDDQVFQEAQPFRPGILKVVDGEGETRGEKLERARATAETEYFSLSAVDDTELRATLAILGPKRCVLSIFLGEALVDGQSAVFVAREIAKTYSERTGQTPAAGMGGSDVRFLDYVSANPVPADVIERAMDHWQSLAHLRRPVGTWPWERGERTNNVTFRLTKDEWRGVLRTARQLKVTPYVYVLTIFQMAFSRFTGNEEYLINGTIHDRHDPETIGMIGCFDSFVVMRGGVAPDAPLEHLLEVVGERVQETVDIGAAVPASLSGPDAEGRLPYDAAFPSVEMAMFEGRDGPDLPGVRQRRFRFGSGHPALRITCNPVLDGERNFFFSSITADVEHLDQVAETYRSLLMGNVVPRERRASA